MPNVVAKLRGGSYIPLQIPFWQSFSLTEDMNCSSFHEFMQAQQAFLQRAIDEEKWYLSERAGCDVGHELAVEHFWGTHLDRVAHEFRVRYCRGECPDRLHCELAPRAEELKSSAVLEKRQAQLVVC